MSEKKIVSIDDAHGIKRKHEAKRRLKLVETCQESFFDQLPHLIRELFEHTDDDMYELASKSQTDIVETQYFYAMRELRKLREDIESSFQGHLKRIFREFWIGHKLMSADQKEPEPGDLSLIKDEELEEQLAVDGMIAKAETRYATELQALSARFAVLANAKQLELQDNPLAPVHFVDAFRRALRQWDGEIALRLVIFKIFELHVINYVGGLYDSLNEILVAAGVLPKIKRSIKKNPIAPNLRKILSGQITSEAAPAPTGEELIASSRATLDVMERMVSWLAGSRSYRPHSQRIPMSNDGVERPEVSDAEVIDALTQLQRNVLGSPIVTVADVQAATVEQLVLFSELLRLGQGPDAEKRLAERDQVIIDTVGMLFDFVLEERNLPEGLKALIARLQFPLIKVAKLDFSFFGDKNHPARRFLNTLSRAAIFWPDEGDRAVQAFYNQVESVVSQVLAEFTDDMTVFNDANEQLDAAITRQASQVEKAEQRVTQVVRGQEQLISARRRVAEVIHTINLRTKGLPEVVIDFEREAWHDVMMLALLRDGEGSDQWEAQLSTLKILIWSVTPKDRVEDRQKVMKTIPVLLRKIRRGLNDVGFEMSRASSLFERLKRCHRAVLTGKKGELDIVAPDQTPSGAPAENNVLPPLDKAVRARLPQVGDWMKWTDDDGQVYRGKLAWHSVLTGVYIFVNQKGLKLAEISEQKLAELITKGEAETLSEVKKPFMDSVLDSMQALLANGASSQAIT